MEGQDEMIMKKKRSKRPRMGMSSSPLSLTMATSSCSNGTTGYDSNSSMGTFNRASAASSSSSIEILAQEEEDMANCLILLAKGRHHSQAATTDFRLALPDAYQCKTCDRSFHSFQALGGHRASHKKPKATLDEPKIKKPPLTMPKQNPEATTTTTLSLQIPTIRVSPNPSTGKVRVHECTICGAEFTSGQALGGHMRRHRPIPCVTSNQDQVPVSPSIVLETSQEGKKSKSLLSLDLNLPAPEDDHLETKYAYAGKEQVIVFSASPLVNCHY